jgi:putative transposase
LTPEKHRFEHDVQFDVEARVRQGVKAVLEEVLEEEMTQHLQAGYRELTPTRRGERNGYYQRNLLTPAGKIERLTVPRDREGEFVTEVFERYKRMTGDVEEAVLEMYLIWDLGKEDSGSDRRLEQGEGRQGCRKPHRPTPRRAAAGVARTPFGGEGLPLPLPGCHLPKGPLGSEGDWHGALLACVGVDEEGFREVLAVEVAGSEKGAAYASLLRGLIDRGLSDLAINSATHGGICVADKSGAQRSSYQPDTYAVYELSGSRV